MKVTDPELLVPGSVWLVVTPFGSALTPSVTLPVKLVRVTFTSSVCPAPPGVRDSEDVALIEMLGAGFTVTNTVLVCDVTPLPLAVMITG